MDNDGTTSERIFLWLNCEGWQRFGPYKWLKFVDNEQRIVADEGEVVAEKVNGEWLTPGQFERFRWRTPVITASDKHPHPHHR